MSTIRTIIGTEKWMHPRLIPNRRGYRFTARLKNGHILPCETVAGEFEIKARIVCRGQTVKFSDIIDWKEC